MTEKEFKSFIFDNLHTILLNTGLEKAKSQIYTKNITEDITGFVGIGKVAKYKGAYIAITPTVGVRSQKLEKLICEMRKTKYDKYVPATVAVPIGYLMPQKRYHQYIFTLDQIDKARETLLLIEEEIIKYTDIFFNKHQSLFDIINTLKKETFYVPTNTEFRLAAGYYLTNNKDQLILFIKKVMKERKDNKSLDFFYDFEKVTKKLLEIM